MKLQLTTDRLLLRNLMDQDVDDFLEYRSKPEITKYQSFHPYNRQQATDFIRSQKDKEFGIAGEWLQLGVILKTENKLIGDCAIKLDKADQRIAEIGCTISHLFQKQGFAKEVLMCLMKFLFEEFNIHRIVEITDAENRASIKLLESVGFRKEGHFIENIFFKGSWGSEIQYAMLQGEWNRR